MTVQKSEQIRLLSFIKTQKNRTSIHGHSLNEVLQDYYFKSSHVYAFRKGTRSQKYLHIRFPRNFYLFTCPHSYVNIQ